MSDHPHRYFLDEIKIAIKKMVPLTPPEIKQKAEALYAELEATPEADITKFHAALTEIGRDEYPYRKAYHDLCSQDEELRLRKLVLDRVEPEVKALLEETFAYNVLLDDYVKSELFEENMTAAQRYQVTNAILLAEEVLNNQCDDRAHARAGQYEELVEKRKQEVKELQDRIDHLKLMARKFPIYADEILTVANRLEEGWSITETDPTKEEIEKEIEYWQTVTTEDAE